ncbi:MAG TPA: class F sortase [Ktedonobacterales bacterium]|nr:class F sortase [Ktedonobacterales bacterium]
MRTLRAFCLSSRITILYLALVLLVCTSCGPGEPAHQGTHPLVNAHSSQPVRLQVPSLGIDAAIQPVGEDRYGAMEAPGAGHPASDPIWGQAFWWKFGAQPGEPGNAVLAGHVDRNDGSRAVFWNLHSIQPGDKIIITEQGGQKYTFQVVSIEAVDNPTGGPTDPVIQRIFGPATTANLNLITCGGDWIGTEYNQRLVVFSTLAAGT